MTQGNGAHPVPSYDEVERAIRSVPGVAEATIARSQDTGRGRLRIRLQPGEDAERVSWSVAATMRERFGIALDPDEIRPRVAADAGEPGGDQPDVTGDGPHGVAPSVAQAQAPGPVHIAVDEDAAIAVDEDAAPVVVPDPEGSDDEPVLVTSGAVPSSLGSGTTAAAGPAAASARSPWRPTIRDLNSRNDGRAVTVTARLELDGRVVAGEAAGAPTARGLRRAIADATVRAVGELTRSPLRAQVDRVTAGDSDPASVSVVVSLLSGRGEELLLGAAIVRDDVEHAIMRATLDALNRRVEPELVG